MNSDRSLNQSVPSPAQRISGFLAWCGGAVATLVDQVPEERTRLATVGATVLFTGLFAVASSAYAIFGVFGASPWIPIMALIWGATISISTASSL